MNTTYPEVNLWDNLIPIKGGRDGIQLAGWTPGPPVKSGLGCVLYADQMIPVSESISLAADVFTPKENGRYPAILVYAAYNKDVQSSGAPTGTNETRSPPIAGSYVAKQDRCMRFAVYRVDSEGKETTLPSHAVFKGPKNADERQRWISAV